MPEIGLVGFSPRAEPPRRRSPCAFARALDVGHRHGTAQIVECDIIGENLALPGRMSPRAGLAVVLRNLGDGQVSCIVHGGRRCSRHEGRAERRSEKNSSKHQIPPWVKLRPDHRPDGSGFSEAATGATLSHEMKDAAMPQFGPRRSPGSRYDPCPTACPPMAPRSANSQTCG